MLVSVTLRCSRFLARASKGDGPPVGGSCENNARTKRKNPGLSAGVSELSESLEVERADRLPVNSSGPGMRDSSSVGLAQAR